jgi:ferric-dicitrate binding protein FerR (iron transport regulator)
MQTLADGTEVWLNDSSELFYQAIRELNLEGKAYFIVPKKTRPLIVHTPIMDVKVNGAIFDVNAYEGDRITEVNIFGDSASVTLHTNPSKHFRLGSGEKLIVRSGENTSGRSAPTTTLDKVHYQPEDSLFIEAAWVKYRLAGYNTNLEELTPRLQRFYDMKLFVTGDQLKKERFTFVIPAMDIQLTLGMLQTIRPFHYTINKNKEVHIAP